MYSRILSAIVLLFALSCSKSETPSPADTAWQPSTIDGQFVFNTFKSAGLGGSRGKIQKWSQSEVYYWFDNEGAGTSSLVAISDSVFNQINQYTQSCKFIKTTDESKANIKIFSGRDTEFESKYKLSLQGELQVGGTAFMSVNSKNELEKVVVWVTHVFPQLDRRLITRHEIGHAIGFSHVPTKRSIMWDTIDLEYNPTDYTDVDKDYIKILYDSRTKAGMTQEQLLPVYKDILK
ncbi:peptidase M10A and M12B matrixin and adamalysin [Emticicia oligotrophica DSM 17448]|uniref:Peptidase M10A and M12B matrixin and adamalysin n=1 Tax=Emticicia oligotrophica (strain DSM 17448 / CIP 109782 / MTCC 6937 / GPTSA100-15) TaxID=929562 RepID=A0ABN4ADS4_EMTOG|nr:matrixin family metalloprotease [Emticicia oligotrophica]AFK01624.1 peptidase M10A and M12B matrixin and adamalysin [Emticicia oligotrophica DSM 17448]